LRSIAPRRFNPNGAAWLAIMRESRGKRRFAALCSNTGRERTRRVEGDQNGATRSVASI
jgi:hypothetical protein